MKPEATQNFKGTCAATRVRENKIAKAQEDEAKVKCGDLPLENIFHFKYLGSIFSADGDQQYDVRKRVGMAMTRMGQLRHIFNADISINLKMKIYKTAICSLLTYGCETWVLDERTMATINGANARCLSRFTGQDAHAEASSRTRSYDLVMAIRKRRFKWLGHILRMKDVRLVKAAVRMQHKQGLKGSMLMDTPNHLTMEEVEIVAKNRRVWKQLSECVGNMRAMRLVCRRAYLTGRPPLPQAPPPTPTATSQPQSPPKLANNTMTRAIGRRNPRRACANYNTDTHTDNNQTKTPSTTTTQPPLAKTTKLTEMERQARRYRRRDIHEAFFRPSKTKTTKARWAKIKKGKGKKK